MALKHEYTIEILYHFTCGSCQEWWSYTLTPSKLEQDISFSNNEKFWCPHCGRHQITKVKEGFPL